jgi:hypothetical protein
METGNILNLFNSKFGLSHRFLLEKTSGNNFLLGSTVNPYSRLHVKDDGNVIFRVGPPPKRGFIIESQSHNDSCKLISLALPKDPAAQSGCYCLSTNKHGDLKCLPLDQHGAALDNNWDSYFVMSVSTINIVESEPTTKPPIFPAYCLPKWQINRLVSEGYILFNRAIDHKKLMACEKRLNRYLGTPGGLVAGGTQPQLGKLCGEASNCHEVKDLLSGNLAALVSALLGQDNADLSNISGQIAFRFPEYRSSSRMDICTRSSSRSEGSRH